MSSNTDWLVCRQQTYNAVKYQTSDGTIRYPRYEDFLTLMMNYNVKDPRKFKITLDSFFLIYVDLKTGEWEKMELDKKDDHSFESLVELNEKYKEKQAEEKNKIKSMIDKGKRYIWKTKTKK